MFKRSGAILLTLLYITTGIGFALNLHYCGKIITAVKIDVPAKTCADNQMPRKMKCCHNQQLNIKIKDAHQSEPLSILGKLFSFHIVRLSFAGIAFNTQIAVVQPVFNKEPPHLLISDTPVFIKNCTFRI